MEEKHFLEIDLAAIEKLAAETDMLAQREEAAKAKKKTRKATNPGAAPGVDTTGEEVQPAPVVLVYDPEFELMITHCVMGGVEKVKVTLKWDDPGLQWKEKVGACVSRLVQRIAPVQPGPMADLITLGGYVAIWSASNVLFRDGTSPGSVGNNG